MRHEINKLIRNTFKNSSLQFSEDELLAADYSNLSKLSECLRNKDGKAAYRLVLKDYYRSLGYAKFNNWWLFTKKLKQQ